MRPLEFSVKLFDTTSFAADGSNIPRRSCEAYLMSEDYQKVIDDKLGIGGESHKDRKLKADLKGIVGMDDQVLINDNALHYFTKLYFKPGDNFLYADAITFDPELFAGQRKINIQNEIGILASGVRLPVSVVIQALWSRRGVAEKIIRIKGFDFTLNPSFKGAGDIKFYSDIVEDPDLILGSEEIKQFSESPEYSDCVYQTRIFSSNGEVIILDETEEVHTDLNFDKVFSDTDSVEYHDVVRVYGLGSPQVQYVSKFQGKKIEKDKIKEDLKDKIVKDNRAETVIDQLKGLLDEDDQEMINAISKGGRNSIYEIINSVPESEPNRLDLIKYRLKEYLQAHPDKSFSTVASISDRLKVDQQPRFTKMSRLINGYRVTVNSKVHTEDQLLRLKMMFIQDLNLLLKEVLPEIRKGRTFNAIYGLTRFGQDTKVPSDELSEAYRKMIISEAVMKFVPKALYGIWVTSLQSFYDVMLTKVFGESLKDFQMNLVDYKIF